MGDKLLVETNLNAPNGVIDKYNPEGINQADGFIPQYAQRLRYSKIIGGGKKILTTYFKDSLSIAVIRDSTGKPLNKWAIPSGNRFSRFSGSIDDSILVFAFHSFICPSSYYKININTYQKAPISNTYIDFNIADLVTETVYYHSKDGTSIPMYLTHRNDIKMDGSNPTMLYGYGGFDIPMEPFFDVGNIVFIRSGGILATPCIRGGGDFPGWHEKGIRLNKQNSFDDFISAAEYLISKKYTNPQKLAIMGGSNGGLLVGAVMLQRPELFKVVISESGVFDMLRDHLYNIGYLYKEEYGNIYDSVDFKNLIKYSPVQNVKKRISYPATLLVASDNDDRVNPFHSFKFMAQLQANGTSENPCVLYYEKKSGHSGSDNYEIELKTQSYIYSFIFKYLGMHEPIGLRTGGN
jgi:prolyl oligopeptidase